MAARRRAVVEEEKERIEMSTARVGRDESGVDVGVVQRVDGRAETERVVLLSSVLERLAMERAVVLAGRANEDDEVDSLGEAVLAAAGLCYRVAQPIKSHSELARSALWRGRRSAGAASARAALGFVLGPALPLPLSLAPLTSTKQRSNASMLQSAAIAVAAAALVAAQAPSCELGLASPDLLHPAPPRPRRRPAKTPSSSPLAGFAPPQEDQGSLGRRRAGRRLSRRPLAGADLPRGERRDRAAPRRVRTAAPLTLSTRPQTPRSASTARLTLSSAASATRRAATRPSHPTSSSTSTTAATMSSPSCGSSTSTTTRRARRATRRRRSSAVSPTCASLVPPRPLSRALALVNLVAFPPSHYAP